MKVIPGIRDYWLKLWSMRFILLTAGLTAGMTTFSMMPPEWQVAIPPLWIKVCATSMFLSSVLAGVSRVIHQPKLDEEECNEANKHEGEG